MDLKSLNSSQEIYDKLNCFVEEHSIPTQPISCSEPELLSLFEFLLQNVLQNEDHKMCFQVALTAVKIIARKKAVVEAGLTSEKLNLILECAGLGGDQSNSVRRAIKTRNENAILEAQRCLQNMYFLSAKAQNFGAENSTIPSILLNSLSFKQLQIPYNILGADMKILFLVTAQRPEARSLARIYHQGIPKLTSLLRVIVCGSDEKRSSQLTDEEVVIVCDVLKVLFNLTVDYESKQSVSDDDKSELDDLGEVVALLFNIQPAHHEKSSDLVNSCINLLTNFPLNCFGSLTRKPNHEYTDAKPMPYESIYVNSVTKVLMHVSSILTESNYDNLDLRDLAAPSLKTLVCFAHSNRHVRRYLRYTILPPLKGEDLKTRPEEGNTLRNKFCRLFTSPDTSLATMAADLLFVLCKEKVGRFVKHTGYGNAAGLLARRGLMLGGHSSKVYSSSSEDSDTEDYAKKSHLVNPITGYMDTSEKVSPFAGMTEEQKEYEAIKLANLIDRLHNMGVVKPAKLNAEGKPVAVDHILELVENNDVLVRGNPAPNHDAATDSDE